MAVLVALARTPGKLVTRQELLEKLWPGGSTYDEALTQCVYQLRQQLALAGNADDCRDLIKTLPKRGYLLNVDPQAIEPAVDAQATTTTGLRHRRRVVALAGLLAIGAILALFAWRTQSTREPLQGQAQAIAVLPFLPLVEEERDLVLEHGMADTLITRLSGIQQIIVRPVSSVRRYTDLDRDSLKAGRELGVYAVIDGSIQRSKDSLRVNLRLLRVSDGAALWGDTFAAPFAQVFELQDDICQKIATALAPHLGLAPGPNPTQGGTLNTAAYDNYLNGRYHLAQLTATDLRSSVQYFQAAVAIDPEYAQAWLGLANAQFRLPIAGEADPQQHFPAAKVAAERALEINPLMGEGYAYLGWIAHWFEWDWSASEAHFRRAIEMNPSDSEAHLGFAHLLSNIGRHAQALEEVQRARELSPLYPTAAALEGGFLYRAGQADEAIRRLEQSVRLDPGFWLTRVTLASAYMAEGRAEHALAEARLARQASGGGTWAMAAETTILAALGQHAEARAVLDEMRAQSRQRYVPPYDLALATLATGDQDMTMTLLQEAHAVRDPKLAFLNVDRRWRPLHDRPEFRALLKDMQFPETRG